MTIVMLSAREVPYKTTTHSYIFEEVIRIREHVYNKAHNTC